MLQESIGASQLCCLHSFTFVQMCRQPSRDQRDWLQPGSHLECQCSNAHQICVCSLSCHSGFLLSRCRCHLALLPDKTAQRCVLRAHLVAPSATTLAGASCACADGLQEAGGPHWQPAPPRDAAQRRAPEPHRLGHLPHGLFRAAARAARRGGGVLRRPPDARQPRAGGLLQGSMCTCILVP